LEGTIEIFPGICRTSLARGDVYLSLNTGGGGYGDPLDRDLDLVERDLKLGYLTPDNAAALYGAVVTKDLAVARDATQRRHEQLRRERIAKATPQAQPTPRSPQPYPNAAAGTPVTDRLSVGPHQGDLCYTCRCGAVFGKADRDYRDYLPRFDTSCAAAGPYCMDAIAETRLVLRNFVCPGCGGLIEVELAEIS
jgi:hypothetical protein